MWDGGNSRKEVMGLQGSQRLLTRCQRDGAAWVLVVEQCHATHSPLTPSEGKERNSSLVLRSC